MDLNVVLNAAVVRRLVVKGVWLVVEVNSAMERTMLKKKKGDLLLFIYLFNIDYLLDL